MFRIESSAQKVPVLDTQILEGVSCDHLFLGELCQSFLQHAPERVDSLRVAVESRNGMTVRDAAHALKSLSTCVGAMHLFEACRAMELAGKSDRPLLAMSLLKHINIEYGKVQQALQDYQKSLSTTP